MAKQNRGRRNSGFRKNNNKFGILLKKILQFLLLLLLFIFVGYHYRAGIAKYLGFRSDKLSGREALSRRLTDARNFQVLENNSGKAVGIDISEYQGKINWDEVGTIDGACNIDFVVVRATVGNDRVDNKFKENWVAAKDKKIIRGAYHYYRPNENSLEQAALFIKTVSLSKGDLPPVLDIEKLPDNQSVDRLKIGLRRWLNKIEEHYKLKPIIYTGESYYVDFLKEEFSDYLFWIANYNFSRETMDEDWLIWQFTEKAAVPGIKGNVDVNIFNGDLQQLQFITAE